MLRCLGVVDGCDRVGGDAVAGVIKRSAFLHSAHTGGRAAVKRFAGAASANKPSNWRLNRCRVPPEDSRYMHFSSLGWRYRCVFGGCASRCRSFCWVFSGSGSLTARKPRWTCRRWAPGSPWSDSSSAAAWTRRANSSTAACASSTAGLKRRLSTRTNWKSSSFRRTRIRNTGRTFCRRCRGLLYLSKTGIKR